MSKNHEHNISANSVDREISSSHKKKRCHNFSKKSRHINYDYERFDQPKHNRSILNVFIDPYGNSNADPRLRFMGSR